MNSPSWRLFASLLLAGVVACGGGDGGDEASAPPPPASSTTTPPPPPPPTPTPEEACASHLADLHAAILSYKATYGALPTDTGGAFFLKLAVVSPPILPLDSPLFDCPVSSYVPSPGTIEYRGPAADANTYADTDVIAADLVGNHGPGAGGHVLLKDGTVMRVAESDVEWIVASVKTAP